MKMAGLDHPKTLDLASRLNVALPQAIGHLELLWNFVAQKTPHGNIGKWTDGVIARAAHWNEDASIFVKALADSGFLDKSVTHRYLIHDWPEHCPRWVTSKLSRSNEKFAVNDCGADHTQDSSTDCSAEYTQNCSGDSKPSLARPSHAKSNTPAEAGESTAKADDAPPGENKKTNGKSLPCPHEQIIAIYHETLPQLRPVQVWNDTRSALLRSRWREDPAMQDLAKWKELFEFVGESDFLTGRAEAKNGGKPFQADLEWLIRPTNFAKIVEGKYHDAA